MRIRSKYVVAALAACALVSIAMVLAVPVISIFLPDYRDIKEVIGDADTILVREVDLQPDVGIVGGKVLFEVSQPDEVQEVLDMMSFGTEGWRTPCRCTGDPLLEWRKGDVCLARTTFKHTSVMHWVGVGDGSLDLDSGARLEDWLIGNGVTPTNDPRQSHAVNANRSAARGGEAEPPSE